MSQTNDDGKAERPAPAEIEQTPPLGTRGCWVLFGLLAGLLMGSCFGLFAAAFEDALYGIGGRFSQTDYERRELFVFWIAGGALVGGAAGAGLSWALAALVALIGVESDKPK